MKFILPLIQSLVHPCKRNFENMTIILLNNWNRLSYNMNNCADIELKGIIRRDSQNIPKVKTCLSLFKVLVFYARR